MTSALNPQRLLSGNKTLILILCAVLLSCNAFKLATPAPVEEPVEVVETKPEKATPEVKTTKPDVKPAKTTEFVEFFGRVYEVEAHKKEFKIALILPFYYNATTSLERRTSSVMVDYYTGVKTALSILDSQGFKAKLYVYDNQNDTNELKRILGKWEMKGMDLIVGPIKESNMQIVSEFALKHKIGVFSPLSSIETLQTPNKLFYSTSPNLQVKAKNIVTFWEKKYANKKLIIVRDGNGYEKEFVPLLIQELKKRSKIKYTEVQQSASINWHSVTSSNDTTLIYIPTSHAVAVNPTLGGIVSCKRKVVVFGESSWADFEDNDYQFWTALHVHLFTTDYIDYEQIDVINFRQAYRTEYQTDPTLYAYLGYDQFKFMGDFLMAFGELYPRFINDNNFRYLSSSYNFTYQNGFNQNTNFFILGFRDMKLKPIE